MTATDAPPPGRVLAEFAAGLGIEAIPPRTRERVKDLLLAALASAPRGVEDAATTTILATASGLMGPGSATVIGGSPMSLAWGALVNGPPVSAGSLCGG